MTPLRANTVQYNPKLSHSNTTEPPKPQEAVISSSSMGIDQSQQLKTSECHSNWGAGNGLTNQNPPPTLPTPSYILYH
jgi:hypothetical protein